MQWLRTSRQNIVLIDIGTIYLNKLGLQISITMFYAAIATVIFMNSFLPDFGGELFGVVGGDI